MSFSASFNGRPLVAHRNSSRIFVKSNIPARTPGYYNVLKGARGNVNAFAKAVAMVCKGR